VTANEVATGEALRVSQSAYYRAEGQSTHGDKAPSVTDKNMPLNIINYPNHMQISGGIHTQQPPLSQ